MNIPVENVAMLIGAAQGALIGLIIVQKHSALYANRFLALMMFTMSGVLCLMVLDDLGVTLPMQVPVLLSLSLAVTPLHFLYARFLTNRSLRFRPVDGLHFLPIVVFLIAAFAALPVGGDSQNFFREHRPVDQYPKFFILFNWMLIVQGLLYVAVILYRLRAYERVIKSVYSSIDNRRLGWLWNITLLAATAWLSFSIEHTFLSFHINVSNFTVSSVLIAVYLFTLGYLGMLKVEVLETSSPEMEIALSADAAPAAADVSKYEKSGLSPEAAAIFRETILAAMERDKTYRESELTLSQLAAGIGISPHNLSEVINTQLGKTFYDLVNEYRIAEVKQALTDPSKQHLKILAIAFDAGFNSKASFNTIFKQLTHMTPSEYRKNAARAEGSPV